MTSPFASVAARLTEAAQSIAAARIEQLRLARQDPAAAWRKASLLWPRFTKGQTAMEVPLRAALIAWLASDPALSGQLNAIVEEAPSRTALPWLALAASASADWSVKDVPGREVRIALELHCRGDQPGSAAALVSAIEARIASLPQAQTGFRIVTIQFLRARAEQRGANTRAVLLEYRFRLLSA